MPRPYLTVTTADLRKGDVVLCHGMRVLLDSEPRPSKSHPEADGVRYCDGLVLNRDEVDPLDVPRTFTERTEWSREDGRWVALSEHRWAVQGASWVTWAIEPRA